jgi:restriction system protein
MSIPKYDELFNPTLQALKKLGGSASITELLDEVATSIKLSPEDLTQPHKEKNKERSTETEFAYRLAWARTYLKAYKVIDNSSRGVWVLTAAGKEIESVNPVDVKRVTNNRKPSNPSLSVKNGVTEPTPEEVVEEENSELTELINTAPEIAEALSNQTWRDKLWKVLLNLKPDAFERLCQLLLREAGFTQVKVTGRSGDGGIDGFGIVQLGGLVSFPIIFQCKRFKGSVSAGVIRDFRGAMVGRADRGLIITTGTFTRDARVEATRDGAPPVDLVEGERLLDKLKDLRIGVEVKMVEEVSILTDWFKVL